MATTDQVTVQDAEQAVLGAVMIRRRSIDDVRPILGELGMHGPRERATWAAMLALDDRDEAIDPVTLAAELKRLGANPDRAWLASLLDAVPSATSAAHYARIVAEHQRRARLAQRVDEARVDVRSGDPGAVIEQLAEDARALAPEAGQGLVHVGESVRATFDQWSETTQRVQAGDSLDRMHLGLQEADEKIGGLFGGWLILVAGRPGMGKTALLMQIAASVAREGKRVAIFSLEMTRAELIGRMICQLSGVPYEAMRDGRANTQQWREVGQAAAELGGLPVYIDDRAKIGVSEMRAECRRMRPALVCVDYLQLMVPKGGTRDNREREVALIGNGLVALAKELQVPVAVAAALNREVGKRADKRPQLSDLRESGSLEQDAHLVLAPHRPGYYDADKPLSEAELWCLKHRSGPAGWSVALRWDAPCTRFLPVDRDQGEPRDDHWQARYDGKGY